jgi:hypothetical protein
MRQGKGILPDVRNLTMRMSVRWRSIWCSTTSSYSSDRSDESGYGDGSSAMVIEDAVASIHRRDAMRAGTLRIG